MHKDSQFLNQAFNQDTARSYLSDYANVLHEKLKAIPAQSLDAALQLIANARRNGNTVFVGGNGGSAAIAEHLSCDWQKGVHVPGGKSLKVHSLSSNMPLLTAISNDLGYDRSFSFQLELADLKADDVVVLISSSGKSENIVKAAQVAKSRGCKIIGLTGFSGGALKDTADVSLHVPFENYGVVEDAHQVIMHVLAQYHALQFRK